MVCALILLRMGRAVPKAYSGDLRERVIEAVEAGASRREAAELFEVSVASAIKWLQRWTDNRSAAPKPRGGSISPLEEFAAEILALIAERPDLTLVEMVTALRKRRIKTSRSALWRFLDRHGVTLKKKFASCGTTASGCGASATTVDSRARHA
jgi:transposase